MARAMMTKVLMSIIVMFFELALATDHSVGVPGGGWDTSTNLAAWASGQTFNAGDKLVFKFLPNHSVLEVSKDDYDSCSTSNPKSTNAITPATFTLTTAGSRYFICGTPGHCDQGMKVEIKTVAATSSGPPSTPTSPSSALPPPPKPVKSSPSYGDSPSSATIVKMSALSMVGIGFLLMI